MNEIINNIETDNKNKEHIKKTYFDKTNNLLKAGIGLSIFAFIIQLIHFNEIKILGGTFFYIACCVIVFVSAISAFFAKNYIRKNKIGTAKLFIIYALITAIVSTLFIILFCIINHEIINLRSIAYLMGNREIESAYIESGLSAFYGRPDVYCCVNILASALDCVIVAMLQFNAWNSILKADGTVKSSDFVENFYDEL